MPASLDVGLFYSVLQSLTVHQVGCHLSSDSSRVLTKVQVAFFLLLLIYIHPRLCQPVGLPPVLQNTTPEGRSSSWEIPAARKARKLVGLASFLNVASEVQGEAGFQVEASLA